MDGGIKDRKFKRSDLRVELFLQECQGSGKIKVNLVDISQGGLGFSYDGEKIPVGTFYNADIQIWTKEIIPAIIKVVRFEENVDGPGYTYGCEFVIISDTDKFRIATYQTLND